MLFNVAAYIHLVICKILNTVKILSQKALAPQTADDSSSKQLIKTVVVEG